MLSTQDLQHYLKGGKFKVIYQPVKMYDLSPETRNNIGQEKIAYQNCDITPITTEPYQNQMRFNVIDIYGWVPEEDLKIIERLDSYIQHPEETVLHIFHMHYDNEESARKEFGKCVWTLPFIVTRSYSTDRSEYILQIAKNASKIEKAFWQGEDFNELNWTQIK